MVAVRRYLPLSSEGMLATGEVVIELSRDGVTSMALEFGLLLEEMAESLRVQPRGGAAVTLTIVDNSRVAKAVVKSLPDDSIDFAIGRNQAEYIYAVLLRAYRDQAAEVSHVHVEGERDGASFDLTLMFDMFREPMSSEEASKLMAD
jgi:hypothetical protein